MQLLPMNLPAEIHRVDDGSGGCSRVARGPLIIMAHGLLSIAAERRDGFMIRSPLGELNAEQVEEVLRRWTVPATAND
jgi:hypothetical protein